jgi:hypothetical protein
MTTGRRGTRDTIKYGILAGVAGGLAEVAWVSLYAAVTGGNAAALARGVTTAVMLGIALAFLWQALARTHGTGSLYAVALASLAGVWALNFFVVLPAISTAFVLLVPYSVSLLSKLLFGLAAAETLRRCAMIEAARMPVSVRTANGQRHPTR